MTISKIRSALYRLAKVLGDVQAGNKSARTGSAKPITDRMARRYGGKIAGRLLGRIFK